MGIPTATLFTGDVVNTSRRIYTPTEFAKTSLLHLQEVGTLQATKPHISKREKMSSYLIFIVLSGSGNLVYDDIQYELEKGSCVFIDCHKTYSHETSENLWNLSWVHFNGPTVENIYENYTERGGLPTFKPKDICLYQNCFEDLYKIAQYPSYIKDMEINAGLSKLLTYIMSDLWHTEEVPLESKKTVLLKVKAYLDENYEKKITLDELSTRYFINKYYLVRTFKEQFSVSIMDYILRLRITEAKNLLRFSNMSAEEIGLKVGIGDQYYFSRVFKKIEGVSIREYRKQWG